jgi:flagellar biosynthesis protein FliR
MMPLLFQHAAQLWLVLLRVLPVVVLCPLLGGALVAGPVRVGIAVVAAIWIHGACGGPLPAPSVGLLALAIEQLVVGTLIGLASAWVFDVANCAGRWIDIFRGSSAEVSNPAVGSRDSATGALLNRLLLAVASATGATPALLAEVARSIGCCPPGHFLETGQVLERWVFGLSSTFEAGVVIAAPFAVLALSVDLGVAFLQRVAPALPLGEVAVPARLLLGLTLCSWDLLPALTRLLAARPVLSQLLNEGAP